MADDKDENNGTAAAKPATKNNKVAVTFVKSWNRYYPKDVAAFDKETATELVEAKIAVLKK